MYNSSVTSASSSSSDSQRYQQPQDQARRYSQQAPVQQWPAGQERYAQNFARPGPQYAQHPAQFSARGSPSSEGDSAPTSDRVPSQYGAATPPSSSSLSAQPQMSSQEYRTPAQQQSMGGGKPVSSYDYRGGGQGQQYPPSPPPPALGPPQSSAYAQQPQLNQGPNRPQSYLAHSQSSHSVNSMQSNQQQQDPRGPPGGDSRQSSYRGSAPPNGGLGLPASSSSASLSKQAPRNASAGAPTIAGEPLHDMGRAFALLRSSKFYAEGFLMKRVDAAPDGSRVGQENPDGQWAKWFVQLSGVVMSTWNAAAMEEAARQNRTVEPQYLKLDDAFLHPYQGNGPAPTEHQFALNVAGQNRLLFCAPSLPSLTMWINAIRLAVWERSRCNEIYTGSLLGTKEPRISSWQGFESVSVGGGKGKLEGRVEARLPGATAWSEYRCVVHRASTSPPITKEALKKGRRSSILGFGKGKKDLERAMSADGSGGSTGIDGLPGDGALATIAFYKDRGGGKKEQPICIIQHVYYCAAIYPEQERLIEQSTLIKLEGTFLSPVDGYAVGQWGVGGRAEKQGFAHLVIKDTSSSGSHSQSSGMSSSAMLEWIVGISDAFKLYGRPKEFSYDPRDPSSLYFALPVGPHRDRQFLDRELVDDLDIKESRPRAIRATFHNILFDRMRGVRPPSIPASRPASQPPPQQLTSPPRSPPPQATRSPPPQLAAIPLQQQHPPSDAQYQQPPSQLHQQYQPRAEYYPSSSPTKGSPLPPIQQSPAESPLPDSSEMSKSISQRSEGEPLDLLHGQIRRSDSPQAVDDSVIGDYAAYMDLGSDGLHSPTNPRAELPRATNQNFRQSTSPFLANSSTFSAPESARSIPTVESAQSSYGGASTAATAGADSPSTTRTHTPAHPAVETLIDQNSGPNPNERLASPGAPSDRSEVSSVPGRGTASSPPPSSFEPHSVEQKFSAPSSRAASPPARRSEDGNRSLHAAEGAAALTGVAATMAAHHQQQRQSPQLQPENGRDSPRGRQSEQKNLSDQGHSGSAPTSAPSNGLALGPIVTADKGQHNGVQTTSPESMGLPTPVEGPFTTKPLFAPAASQQRTTSPGLEPPAREEVEDREATPRGDKGKDREVEGIQHSAEQEQEHLMRTGDPSARSDDIHSDLMAALHFVDQPESPGSLVPNTPSSYHDHSEQFHQDPRDSSVGPPSKTNAFRRPASPPDDEYQDSSNANVAPPPPVAKSLPSSFAENKRAKERAAQAEATQRAEAEKRAALSRPGRAAVQAQPQRKKGAWQDSDEDEEDADDDDDDDDDDESPPLPPSQPTSQGTSPNTAGSRPLPQVRPDSYYTSPQARQSYLDNGPERRQSSSPAAGQHSSSDDRQSPAGQPRTKPVVSPHGLLAAGILDKEERSARALESQARQEGGPLLSIPSKPPPPQTGLVGAITSHEREKNQTGGVGRALTEQQREQRLAQQRQKQQDELEQRQRQQAQQQAQFGGYNPMAMNPMAMNPWMMSQMGYGSQMGFPSSPSMGPTMGSPFGQHFGGGSFGGGGSQMGVPSPAPVSPAPGSPQLSAADQNSAVYQQQQQQHQMMQHMMAQQAAQAAYMQAMSQFSMPSSPPGGSPQMNPMNSFYGMMPSMSMPFQAPSGYGNPGHSLSQSGSFSQAPFGGGPGSMYGGMPNSMSQFSLPGAAQPPSHGNNGNGNGGQVLESDQNRNGERHRSESPFSLPQ